MSNGTRYEAITETTDKRTASSINRFGEGRQARINAFRGVTLGIGQVPDLTEGERLAALVQAHKSLLTEATLRVASEAATNHRDLKQGLDAVAKAQAAQAATPYPDATALQAERASRAERKPRKPLTLKEAGAEAAPAF